MPVDLQLFRREILGTTQAMINDALGRIRQPNRIVDVPLVIGARGTVLAINDHVFFRLGLNGIFSIMTWSMAGTIAGASALGTIAVDLLVGNTLAGVATICGPSANRPTLTAQAELSDQTPSANWTATQLSDPQWLMARVTSTGGTLEVVSITLRGAVTPR